jgi:hypothetical protein
MSNETTRGAQCSSPWWRSDDEWQHIEDSIRSGEMSKDMAKEKKEDPKELTPEERQKIALSYYKGGPGRFESWIIPQGALPPTEEERNLETLFHLIDRLFG